MASAITPPSAQRRFLQFLGPIAGHTYSYSPGDCVEYAVQDFTEVERLIDRNIAEEVTEKHALECAARTGRVAVKRHRIPPPPVVPVPPPTPPAAGGTARTTGSGNRDGVRERLAGLTHPRFCI